MTGYSMLLYVDYLHICFVKCHILIQIYSNYRAEVRFTHVSVLLAICVFFLCTLFQSTYLLYKIFRFDICLLCLTVLLSFGLGLFKKTSNIRWNQYLCSKQPKIDKEQWSQFKMFTVHLHLVINSFKTHSFFINLKPVYKISNILIILNEYTLQQD